MIVITPEILAEFKDRMHLEGDEDANLLRILSTSDKELRRLCGKYDIQEDEPFKELVFERARYAYNDALEYFNKNFLWEINSLATEKAIEGTGGEPIATIQIQAESEFRRLTQSCGSLGECEVRE